MNTYEYTDFDRYLFHEGTHYELYKIMGAHPMQKGSQKGTLFRLWAPHAKKAAVLTERYLWNSENTEMDKTEDGIWEVFLPYVGENDLYRYEITTSSQAKLFKSDPFAFCSQLRPENASVVIGLKAYEWSDDGYLQSRNQIQKKPVSIYELHIGSWKRHPDGGFLSYRDIAGELIDYLKWMGYTHVELMGICEHPFDGSWGYQVSGYYSPTSRYGSPEDLKYLINELHKNSIGVIMDWVPAHFVKDDFALRMFDGEYLFEPADRNAREFEEWGTCAFDYSKPEVKSFMISNAFYWIREFHMDGLRVDAVASMLYLDYAGKKWVPNLYGDNRNLEGIAFLKQLNLAVKSHTDAMMIAEDSSIEEGMTSPVEEGGFGFTFKWNMGWMNDSLRYLKEDPVFRTHWHAKMTGTVSYSFLEHYILVLSHDEVVHLKKAMFNKMPGSQADRIGNLKAYYLWQFMHPGKKLLFMGQDFGAEKEWNENDSLDWSLTQDLGHREILLFIRSLNRLYKEYSVLYENDTDSFSFEWINSNDGDRDIVSFIRKNDKDESLLLCIINFSRNGYDNYSVGTPFPGYYTRILSTYDVTDGGGGPEETGEFPVQITEAKECDQRPYRLNYRLRPNEGVVFCKNS